MMTAAGRPAAGFFCAEMAVRLAWPEVYSASFRAICYRAEYWGNTSLGRKSWLFAGSDRGGERAAVMYTLIQTARLNDVDPQAWLADVLARINDHNIQRLDELLPWNWKNNRAKLAA
jgi:hypothetical protein